jgi:hypothetical protein
MPMVVSGLNVELPFFGPFVMWRLCIEEDVQVLGVTPKRNNDAKVNSAFAGMGLF